MSRGSRRATVLAIVATDATFAPVEVRGQTLWQGKCIHCNRKLVVDADGDPIGSATVEHIVPRHHGGTDALSNLALACERCNNQKGYRHDLRRSDDPKLMRVIETLAERRRQRWRDPP